MEPIKAYPLAWPVGWKRTPAADRRRAQFHTVAPVYRDGQHAYNQKSDLTVAAAISRIQGELRRMGIRDEDLVISTNLVLRLDGLPRSDQRRPQDPGAAVYWVGSVAPGQPRRCMAVDMYDLVEHNLAAIAATLDALRAIERRAAAAILDRAFTGFTALPAPVTGQKPWRQVLGFDHGEMPSADLVRAEYRQARSDAHPDKRTGSHEEFLAVQAAYEAAARELGFSV